MFIITPYGYEKIYNVTVDPINKTATFQRSSTDAHQTTRLDKIFTLEVKSIDN